MTASPNSATGPPKPLPWLPPLVHAVVLGGGLYAGTVAAGPSADPLRLGGFTTCLLLLAVLDRVEIHRHPGRPPVRPALVLLLARIALSAAASALDGSGVARALFVLLPLTAYFAFGRRVAVALGAGCVAVVLAGNTLWEPGWYVRPDDVTDLLMSGLALVLAVATATVAAGEQDSRLRLAHTLDELRDAHERLTGYAARVARLSTVRERNRLAREFHDGLGHHLTAIAIQLEKASAFHERDPDTARQALVDARRSADHALDDVRRSVRAMRDEDGPEPFSLSAALADLVRHADGGGPTVTLDLSGDEHGHRAEALAALYRAAQEGLTNARRHAGATKVRLSAQYAEHEARLVVADDGRGFRADALESGFGLRAMHERLVLLDGRVDVDTGPGRGTVVTARVPRIPAPAPEADR
ncbi:sensor histidine kinase [Streptomyces sp. NPDC059874]|uniref:sensor histidine kinase n=1 Tax=Streptomyces sp. NPDC059874 TaxID=3346983 RepID=UPI00365E312C